LQYGRGKGAQQADKQERAHSHFGYERMLLAVKDSIKRILPLPIYNFGKRMYEQSIVRTWLLRLKQAVANRQMRKLK